MIQDEIQYSHLPSGISIAYTDSKTKSKDTILFIHGLANYLQVWQWNTLELKETIRCIAIDLPGNGLSSRGNYPYSIEFFTETIIEFIIFHKLKNVTLAGHSMGGMIALECALKESKLVNKLALFAPAGFEYYTPHEAILFKSAIAFGDFLNMDEVHISQSINTSFYKSSPIAQKIIDDLNKIIQNNDRVSYRKMLDLCISSMLDHQIFNRLKHVSQPVITFFGENDMLIPNRFLHPVSTKDLAIKANKELQHGTLVTYPNTGHFVQIEQALAVNNALAEFMKAN